MPLIEISVIPVGANSVDLDVIIRDAVFLVEEKGIDYKITPTGIVTEGELDQLMKLAEEIHLNALKSGAKRTLTNIVIDDRLDAHMSIEQQARNIADSIILNRAISQY